MTVQPELSSKPTAGETAPHQPAPKMPGGDVRGRVVGARLQSPWIGSLVLLAVMAFAALLRFPNLGRIHKLIFDETYYVKQAYTLWRHGYERSWPDKSDERFTAGTPDIYLPNADYPVHPPVGKWMISFGEMLFGIDSSFGWRFSAAVCGVLMVGMVGLCAWLIFRSWIMGAIAGILMAVDGHHIVHSRTSLLDIFVAFWGLAAFTALLLDREQGRRALARRVTEGGSPNAFIVRPWRLVLAVCLGLMIGTKWSGMYFTVVFCIAAVLWDIGARRAAGSHAPWRVGVLKDGLPSFLIMVPAVVGTYLASWGGWFFSKDAHMRQWGAQNPDPSSVLPDVLRGFVKYHQDMWAFHVSLSSSHPYQSNPWSWVAQWRPVNFFYETPDPSMCGGTTCAQSILNLGNVVVWWGGGLALLVCIFMWLFARDWRAGAILLGILAGYAPWFMYQNRTIYAFYAVAFEPFIVLALTYALALIWGPAGASRRRRMTGVIVVTSVVVAAMAIAAFFYPIWVADIITKAGWDRRIWLQSWI